ncbi:MAG: hypothetical protein HRF43_06220 [Phycisphaerae bacterium]
MSFWHHFPPAQASGPAAVEAHLRFRDTYDLDFLKVMNDHFYPRGEVTVIQTVGDLRKVRPLPPDAGGFGGQLQVLRELRKRLGPDVPMCTTLFNAWTVLRIFTAPPSDRHGPPKLDADDERDETLTRLLKEDRSAVAAAVAAIGESLAGFARACLQAGADGVFLSVRDDWVNRPANGAETYDRIVRPTDLAILSAVAEARFNVLHACGRPMNFKAFAEYPVQVLNWADRAAGPSIAYARDRVKPAIAGGVDNLNTLPNGTPAQCAAEVRDALRQAKDRPILITAGCTFDPDAVPPENLRAVVAAARGG